MNASSILLLCDSGGSNNAKHYIFKKHLQEAVNKIGIEVRIAHFPPYTSKYNPIEHLFFPHVTRVCKGVIFTNVEMVMELMQKTATKKGLRAFVSINNKAYKIGEKVSDEYKKNMPIVFDDYLPKWNYTVIPENIRVSSFHSLVSIQDNLQETKAILKRTIQTLEQNFPEVF